jgi:hypothetical protein
MIAFAFDLVLSSSATENPSCLQTGNEMEEIDASRMLFIGYIVLVGVIVLGMINAA